MAFLQHIVPEPKQNHKIFDLANTWFGLGTLAQQ